MSIVTLIALFWAFAINDPGPAPDYALGAGLIYRLEQAIAVVLLLVIPAIVVAQLLTGRLPKSVGREGVAWDGGKEIERRVDEPTRG